MRHQNQQALPDSQLHMDWVQTNSCEILSTLGKYYIGLVCNTTYPSLEFLGNVSYTSLSTFSSHLEWCKWCIVLKTKPL